MAKISGSSSSSSAGSTGNNSFGSSVSRDTSTSKFESLSQFSGKFSAVAMPQGQVVTRNGQGITKELAHSTSTTIMPQVMTHSLGLLQRTILQDRVMLSTAEAGSVQAGNSVVKDDTSAIYRMGEQGATPAGFWNKMGKALLGIALLPVLPFIGLYKLGDWATKSAHKEKETSPNTMATAGNTMPPPPPAATAGMNPPLPSPPAVPSLPPSPPKVASSNYGTII